MLAPVTPAPTMRTSDAFDTLTSTKHVVGAHNKNLSPVAQRVHRARDRHSGLCIFAVRGSDGATTLLMLVFGARVLMRRVSRVSAAFFGLTVFASIWFAAFTMMYLARTRPPRSAGRARVLRRAVHRPGDLSVQRRDAAHRPRRRRRRLAGHGASPPLSARLRVDTSDLIPACSITGGATTRATAPSPAFPSSSSSSASSSPRSASSSAPIRRRAASERMRIRLLIIAFGIAYFGCVDFLAKYGIAGLSRSATCRSSASSPSSRTPSGATTSCRSRRRSRRTRSSARWPTCSSSATATAASSSPTRAPAPPRLQAGGADRPSHRGDLSLRARTICARRFAAARFAARSTPSVPKTDEAST